MRGVERGIRWVGHPITIVGIVALLLNDHLFKEWWPGLVTGKVSDFAGLVVAPAVLASGLALVVPVRGDRLLPWSALIATGVGFSVVKLTVAGAELAGAAWSVVAGPSQVLADRSDLVALPALGLAWWAWRRSTVRWAAAGDAVGQVGAETDGAAPGRIRSLITQAQVLIALPLALLAVTATSKGDPPEQDPTVGVQERAALWTGLMPESLGEPETATVTGDAVVVATRQGGVAVFHRRTGVLRWQHEIPAESERWRKVRVTRDAVLVFLPGAVQILDLSTGKLRREVAKVTGGAASETTLYLTTCEPRCGIQAFDIASGRLAWEHTTKARSGSVGAPAYWAELSVTPGEPARERRQLAEADRLRPLRAGAAQMVLAEQYQGEGKYRTLALDANTGKVLSAGEPLPDGERFAVGSAQTHLRWREARQPCEASVSGHDARTGSVRWATTIRLPEQTDGMGGCANGWTPQIDANALLITAPDGRPQAIDIDSGRARWSGQSDTYPIAMAGGLVVVRHQWQAEITGYDVVTGQRRWVADLPKDGDGGAKRVDQAIATGDRFVYQTTFDPAGGPDSELTWVRDAQTGQLQWVGKGSNAPLGGGSDWLVTHGRRIAGTYLTGSPSYAEPPAKYTDTTNQFDEIRLFML